MPRGDPTSPVAFRANESLRRRLEFLAAERKQRPATLVKDAVEAAVDRALLELASNPREPAL